MENVSSESIYPDLDLLPGLGRIAVAKALDVFVQETCPRAKTVYVKAHRTACPPKSECRVYSLLDHGTLHEFQHVGILCVARDNVIGGLQYWSQPSHPRKDLFVKELRPGDMAFFDTQALSHTISNVSPLLDHEEGHLDFLVFFGNC